VSEANIEDLIVFSMLKEAYIKETGILNDCYLCEFTKISTYIKNCGVCPCIKTLHGGCLNGLYDDVLNAFNARNKELFKKFAVQIANLPVINPLYK